MSRNAWAKWLVSTAYPYDWRCDHMPPISLDELTKAWIEHDFPDDTATKADYEDYKQVLCWEEPRFEEQPPSPSCGGKGCNFDHWHPDPYGRTADQ